MRGAEILETNDHISLGPRPVGRTPVSAEQSALDDTEKTKKVSGGAAESGNPEVTDDDEKSMSTRSDTHERNESPAVIDGEERTHEGRGGQEDAAQRLARGREGAGEGGDVSKVRVYFPHLRVRALPTRRSWRDGAFTSVDGVFRPIAISSAILAHNRILRPMPTFFVLQLRFA